MYNINPDTPDNYPLVPTESSSVASMEPVVDHDLSTVSDGSELVPTNPDGNELAATGESVAIGKSPEDPNVIDVEAREIKDQAPPSKIDMELNNDDSVTVLDAEQFSNLESIKLGTEGELKLTDHLKELGGHALKYINQMFEDGNPSSLENMNWQYHFMTEPGYDESLEADYVVLARILEVQTRRKRAAWEASALIDRARYPGGRVALEAQAVQPTEVAAEKISDDTAKRETDFTPIIPTENQAPASGGPKAITNEGAEQQKIGMNVEAPALPNNPQAPALEYSGNPEAVASQQPAAGQANTAKPQ